ncbi:glycosyl transferase [Gemmobacter lanyuensis]|uniref:Glycosyl transferase n=1 Tax=Gemmobacter lanyuensis TaxID=1054497 RepID=A0A918MJB0_9RHOB|nr:glycosyltransferase family 2 protein [Gemmobacter lanyuensis]GGW26495.1 glycosyl transferase [Gemmobacter lanyuensis]
MPTVLTVILNWRTPDMTLQAAEAALRAMEGVEGAITIVDNDSGDGSYETMLAEVAARGWDRGAVPVRVLQSGWNGGFGAGNNYGIRAGLPGGQRPDFVYILNSDAFPAPDAIRALRDHLIAHPATGFAGSFIHGDDGAPHQTAFTFPSVWSELEGAARLGPISRLLRRHVVARPVPAATCRVDWLAGASLMMRQDVLDRIGLFDETFFLYFEETDLCLRAARAGWPTDYVPASRVMHIGSVSTGMGRWTRIPKFWLDSRRHYFTKNHGRIGAHLATLAHVSGGALWRLRLLVQRKERGDPPHFLRDLIRHHLRGAGACKTKARPAE